MTQKKDITVLTIDDEILSRQSIADHLEDSGFSVLQAENGKTGLEIFRNEKPDIVLVDLRMPGFDGLDVISAISTESPQIPLIVVSGTGVIQDVIDALRYGAWDFLVKPIADLAVLEHAVNKCLERADLLRENQLYRENLEEEVRIRTVDLERRTEETLKAKEAAEQANQAKTSFLTTMSHELRTPMNGVLGMAQLALQTNLDDQQRYYIEVISQSGQALLDILNEILDLSRIEANKIELERVDFDLGESIENIVHLFSGSADTKGLQLNCRIPVHIPLKLIGDPNRLNQILSNLIANALKFTEQGEISLTINKLKESKTTVDLFFGVTDTGIGISQEKLDVIFQPFSQVDNSTTRKFGGTGLGLTIVKNLVELMGGVISVDSETGTGSTFWVTLPFQKQEKQEEILIPDFSNERVLIINNHRSSCEFLLWQTKQWKMSSECTSHGKKGLEKLREAIVGGNCFNLLIVDNQLPDIAIFDLLQQIENERIIDFSRIIVLTSIHLDKVKQEIEKIGITHCLLKPVIQTKTLYETVFKALNNEEIPQAIIQSVVETRKDTKKRNILIVEDDLVNQQVIVGMLESIGYLAQVASNGEEALNFYSNASFDLIFMDCLMPEMDGFDATRAIRKKEKQNKSLGRIPIIAFTAKAMKGDRELCIASGMDDYLTKPIKIKDLQQIIDAYL
ncbi:response regulator [bacterium]|nr:response regulator [bacterium]